MIAQGVGGLDVAVAFADGVAGNLLLPHGIEQSADGEGDVFILRDVADATLPNEVNISAVVFLVHSHDPTRQGDTHMVDRCIAKSNGVEKGKLLGAGAFKIAVDGATVLPVGNAGFVKESDLFLLIVGQGFPERNLVNMVSGESLLLDLGSRHGHGKALFHHLGFIHFPDAVDIAGETGNLGMGIGDTGAVVDGYPSDKIELVFV